MLAGYCLPTDGFKVRALVRRHRRQPRWPPLVGKEWIGPFRAHHVDPKDITRHGVAELNGTNAMFAYPALALATYYAPGSPYLCTAVASAMFFALVANQLRQWARARLAYRASMRPCCNGRVWSCRPSTTRFTTRTRTPTPTASRPGG